MQRMNKSYFIGKNEEKFEVLTNNEGNRLWINNNDGYIVARFNTDAGADLNLISPEHKSSLCHLWRRYGKPDLKTWQDFTTIVKTELGISLPYEAINLV